VTWLSERGVSAYAANLFVAGAATSGSTGTAPSDTGPVDVWPDRVAQPGRLALWSAAVAMIGEAPLLGIGPGGFRQAYGTYLGMERWDGRVSANDLYLELGATTGLLGLGAFLLVVGGVLLVALRSMRHHAERTTWIVHACLVGAIVAFLVHGVFDYFLAEPAPALVFWTLLGLCVALARPAGTPRASEAVS
jgi:O-antigen ligase